MSSIVYAWRWCKCGVCGRRHRDVLPLTPAQHSDKDKVYSVRCDHCAYHTDAAREAYSHLRTRLGGNDPLRGDK